MAIILNDNLKILIGAPIDDKYLDINNLPYSNTSGVTTAIGIGQRYAGLTVNVNNEEYWFKDGLTDIDLVQKITASGGTTGGLTTLDNIGSGTGEIFSGLSGTSVAQLRTIKGSGDTIVTTNGAEIIIFSEATGNTQPIYTGTSPSNIDAGGMPSGTPLTGKTLSEIIEDIATTVYTPVLMPPYGIFIDNQTVVKEVGITLGSITFTATVNDGDVILEGISISGRSGSANTYNYSGTGLPLSFVSTATTDIQSITNYEVLEGSNIWSSTIDYDAGGIPLDSNGDPFAPALPAGTTSSANNTISGIFPWFYGTVAGATRPTANQALINSGNSNKQVTASGGAISIGNYNATGEWIWFAIPVASTSKAKWEGSNSPSNTGVIGGVVSAGGNLFPDPDVVTIQSPDYSAINWNGEDYKIYISNYPTSTYDGGNPYTLTFKNS